MTAADKCPGNTYCFFQAATTAGSVNVPGNGRRKGLGNASCSRLRVVLVVYVQQQLELPAAF